MPLALAIVLTALGVTGLACAVYWGVAWGRITHTLRTLPTLRDGAALAPAEPAPRVCAIVPAHNEEGALPALLESLLTQDHASLSVVLSLDRCTDSTEALARAFAPRFAAAGKPLEILTISACPEGWAGKTHALWRAVQDSHAARAADLLLFLDADTFLEPACVRASVALLRSRDLGMLSILSGLTTERWFERLAQPAAALELLRQYPLTSANRWPDPRPFANGQCMLFTRAAYDACGGHESVRAELLEDIAIARRLFYAQQRTGLLLAGGLLRCRMYAGWAEFRRGWKRIYTESANRRSDRLAALANRLRAAGVALPACSLLALLAGALAAWAMGRADWPAQAAMLGGIAGLIAHTGAMRAAIREQRAPWWAALVQPVGAWLVAGILSEAAADLRHGRTTAWGGLTYKVEDRGGRPTLKEVAQDPALARW